MRAPLQRSTVDRHPARRVLCTIAAVLFAAAALSCASVRPATRARVIAPPPAVAPVPDDAVLPAPYGTLPPPGVPANAGDEAPPGAPPGAGEEAPPDLGGVPPGTVVAPPADRIPARPTGKLIALVLQLDEPVFARAASAVRDGFFDAATAAGRSGDCIVIGHGRDDVVGAFAIARSKGVRVAVGPLVRDDLKMLAIADADLPWTLALNQLDDGTKLPASIYSFPLTVESDGRTLARRAHAVGFRSMSVVEGDSPLMKRLANSFARQWTDDGGAVPSAFRLDPAPEALTGLRRSIAGNPLDAVLLAVNGEHAALVKPFIGNVTAYASGLVFERPPAAVARDLDGVRVVEIPWLLTPGAPEFAALPRRDFDSDSLTRLYALGLDAFRIAAAYTDDGPPDQLDFEGATGHIHLGPGHEFQREGRLGVYRDGVLVPLDSPP